MFVVVALVRGVAMPIVQVVQVIAVLDCLMRAVGTAVLVLQQGVLSGVVMFVVVAVMLGVAVAIMEVVQVVAVLDCVMGTVGTAVLVL
ncbi:hypothetical protein [Arthrobacter sp. ISL-30]|uniref:hypothetical protein n=1 Tax=Arthrobacter sp. ISL-30 TaxID=2819109 RepID=UPI001BEB55DF|nr:hypothetical protein [Arthrobacter sp. ISL-30]MBT2512574.1 hypothetical protein [Arthrobacter sp. ISL-30]